MELPQLRLRRASVPSASGFHLVPPNEAEDYENAEPLSPAARMFSQPQTSIFIICIVKLKDPIHNIPAFKQGTFDTLVQHKRFSSVMRLDKWGHETWVQTEIDIDKHVIVPSIPSEVGSSDLVEEYASNLSLTGSFDPSRPLWNVHILNVRSENSAAAMILRLHHSLGDGTSLMSFFLSCTRRLNDPDKPPSVVPMARKKPQRSYLQVIWNFFLVIWYSLISIVKFLATLLFLEDSLTPIKGFAGVEQLPYKISSLSFSLNKLKIVKAATGATINDVLLGMISAGITRYLLRNLRCSINERDVSVKKEIGQQDRYNLKGLQITATSLMNIRPSIGLQEVSRMLKTGSQARWGNQMGYMLVPLSINDCEDPLEHVRKAKLISTQKKMSIEAYFTYTCGALIVKLFGPNVAANIIYRTLMHTTLSLSNMIGPLEQVTFLGNEVISIAPTSIGQPQALCIHMQSYSSGIHLVASAATSIIPDPKVLLQHCVEALEDMVKASVQLSSNNKDSN